VFVCLPLLLYLSLVFCSCYGCGSSPWLSLQQALHSSHLSSCFLTGGAFGMEPPPSPSLSRSTRKLAPLLLVPSKLTSEQTNLLTFSHSPQTTPKPHTQHTTHRQGKGNQKSRWARTPRPPCAQSQRNSSTGRQAGTPRPHQAHTHTHSLVAPARKAPDKRLVQEEESHSRLPPSLLPHPTGKLLLPPRLAPLPRRVSQHKHKHKHKHKHTTRHTTTAQWLSRRATN